MDVVDVAALLADNADLHHAVDGARDALASISEDAPYPDCRCGICRAGRALAEVSPSAPAGVSP